MPTPQSSTKGHELIRRGAFRLCDFSKDSRAKLGMPHILSLKLLILARACRGKELASEGKLVRLHGGEVLSKMQ